MSEGACSAGSEKSLGFRGMISAAIDADSHVPEQRLAEAELPPPSTTSVPYPRR